MPVITPQVRVRYAETDQMGIVYYANYLVWFELGRVELLRSLGLAYSRLEMDHGCILPVIESQCRYRSPASYGWRHRPRWCAALCSSLPIASCARRTTAARTRCWPRAKPCTWSATTS